MSAMRVQPRVTFMSGTIKIRIVQRLPLVFRSFQSQLAQAECSLPALRLPRGDNDNQLPHGVQI